MIIPKGFICPWVLPFVFWEHLSETTHLSPETAPDHTPLSPAHLPSVPPPVRAGRDAPARPFRRLRTRLPR